MEGQISFADDFDLFEFLNLESIIKRSRLKLGCAKMMLTDINGATKLHFEHRSIN